MAVDFDTTPSAPEQEPEPQWQKELEEAGLFRRMLLGRRWYGADWWFVTIAAVMVVGFIVLSLFPSFFAPFDPDEQVGPRFLSPGESPVAQVLIVRADDAFTGLADFAGAGRVPVGVVQGTPASEAVRDETDRLNGELGLSGGDRIRLEIERYESPEETFDALASGEVEAVAASSATFAEFEDSYPSLSLFGSVEADQGTDRSFAFGTDSIGRDMLSRVLWGARVSLLIGFSASIFSLVIGVPLGLIAGFTGGRLDRLLTLLMDSLYAFPGLVLAIAITAVLGPSIFNIILAIAVLYIPTYYRIVRGQTLSTKESLFVEAAQSIGAKSRTILRHYIYPNVIPSVAIIFSVNIADAILTGAGLSFLGLGLPPDIPDWGIDIARGIQTLESGWWVITFPGIAVMLVVLAFTLLGEGLMEIFNPKLRDR